MRASPTIREALAAFVAERAVSDVPAKEVAQVCELLCSYLDGYAYESLSAAERAFWEREWEADEEAGAFTRVFGAERIAEHIPTFLSWYLVRKVIAPEGFLRTAGSVTRRLVGWLSDRGSLAGERTDDLRAQADEAEYALPRAERLGALLYDTIPTQRLSAVIDERDLMSDMCAITRMEPGRLWITAENGEQIGPIRVSEEASRLAQLGWRISALRLARLPRRGWVILEMGNVYPL